MYFRAIHAPTLTIILCTFLRIGAYWLSIAVVRAACRLAGERADAGLLALGFALGMRAFNTRLLARLM